MPKKAGSKYKIDRRRTRQRVGRPAVEHDSDESESSVASESENNESEYDADEKYDESEDDEVEYDSEKDQIVRQRQPKRKARALNCDPGGENKRKGDITNMKDSDDDIRRPPKARPARSVVRVTRTARRGNVNLEGHESGGKERDFGAGNNNKGKSSIPSKGQTRGNARMRSRKQPARARRRSSTTKSPALSESEDDEYRDSCDSIADDESDLNEEESWKGDEKGKKKIGQKNVKSEATHTPRNTRSSSSRSNRLSSTRRRQSQSDEGGGDILASLPSPPSTGRRCNAVKTKRKLTKMAKVEVKHDDGEDDDDRSPSEGDSGNEDESYNDDEEEKEVDKLLQKRRKEKVVKKSSKSKRTKAVHSSDEEFVLDSDDDDDDSSRDHSFSNDSNAGLTEDDNEILMVGDPDFSDDDSNDKKIIEKGNKHANNIANVDNEKFGTVDDEDDDDDDGCNDGMAKKYDHPVAKTEILPLPSGVHFGSNGDSSDEDIANGKSKMTMIRRQAKCPRCPSTEDAITAEPLPRLHVCYVTPDGKSRQCFNLETLRQIALKSSQLELRVDIDGERQNFLQPPAFRTTMSDDLVDQIASKFGRCALDLHGAYYKNRETKCVSKDDKYTDDSNSSSNENIYDSIGAFRERMKAYFKNGMGSQDVYVCPLCYSQVHRTMANPDNDNDDVDVDADKEYDAAPNDSIYDPITVLGHLDNEDMSIASTFCFKKLVDLKKHLRQEHNIDTSGIQGNELYMRFRVRAPDGLLQRWLSSQVRGQVKQGHMRMYWCQGNDQVYIHLLDLIEQVRVYSDGWHLGDDESSVEDDTGGELNENLTKAKEFFDTFATKAFRLWQSISSPFLKSNENINDFIAKDDDSIDEKDPDEQPHAILHQQFMNSANEESDENDLVHKLQRKYTETSDYETDSDDSSSEEKLEFVDDQKDANGEDDDQGVCTRNGYYSPVEEEKDEWMLKLQSQQKRKVSRQEKVGSVDKLETPVGKKLFRRKPTPTGTSSSAPVTSKKKRKLTIEDSSDDESF